MQDHRKTKTIKFFLKFSVSAFFLLYIVFKIDWRDVWAYLTEIKWWQIVLYAIIYILGIFISAYKWKILATCKKFHFQLKDYFGFYLTGTLINNFMPSFVGGDAFRAYQIGRVDERYSEAASTVLVDRITGFVGAIILVFLFSVLNFKFVTQNPLMITANLLLLFSFCSDIFIILLRKTPFWELIKKYIPQFILKTFLEIRNYNSSKKTLWRATGWGIIFNIVGVGAANYVLFQAMGIKIGILDYGTVIFLISIISALPVSINNIGIKEWGYITFFGLFGLDSAAVVSVAILSRFLQMILSFFALPAYLRSRR